jgi:hypothetical protein
VPAIVLALFLLGSPVHKLVLASDAGAAGAAVRSNTPVVMVVFDEFPLLSLLGPGGEIDRVRYPHFAALASTSTWFRRTLTVSGDTTQAVPALLTGQTPESDDLPFFSDHPDNLFTLLGGSYRLDVVEPLTSLCPPRLCRPPRNDGFVARERSLLSDVGIAYLHVVLPDELRERLPSITGTWADFRGSAIADSQASGRPRPHAVGTLVRAEALRDLSLRDEQFRAFVASLRPSRRPALDFLHVVLPHHPWRYLPSGREYADATLIPGLVDDVWTSDPVLVEQGYERHLLQVAFVDRLLGELVARLRRTGLYERSLLVVTADHGVAFRAGEHRRRFRPANVAELGLVPLFVKEPGQRRGRTVDGLVRTTDVLPTIADVLDVRPTERVDGRSALGSRRTGAVRVAWSSDAEEGFSITPRQLERKLDDALARQVRLFGWGRRGRGLYRVGPYGGLVGRRVAGLQVRDGAGVTVSLAHADLFAAASRGSLSPAHVVGTLDGVGPGRDVAVAVNGRIAATGRTFSFGGSIRFEALAADSAFRPGANEVAVYLVTRNAVGVVLERAGSS